MILHRVDAKPRTWHDGCVADDICTYPWEQKALDDTGADEGWYWYVNCGYDGAGTLLLRKESWWRLVELYHCSCFGPLEHLMTSEDWTTLDNLVSSMSADAMIDLRPLLDACGYKPKETTP